MAITDSTVWSQVANGNTNSLTLAAAGAKRIQLFFRGITFASSDRVKLFTSVDGGTTIVNGAGTYNFSNSGVTLPSTAFASAGSYTGVVFHNNTTAAINACVDIEGLASSIIPTDFLIPMASDSGANHVRRFWRVAASVENAIRIATEGGAMMTGGSIIARIET